MNDGLSHSIDFFGAFVVGLFEVYAFGHFGPALGGLGVFNVMDQLLFMLQIFLFAVLGLLLFFAEEFLQPFPALIFALLFQTVFLVLIYSSLTAFYCNIWFMRSYS
jgi:hypothetical protein